jgi:DNA-binding NtrC family response regulator
MGDVALAAGDLSLAMTLYEQDKALCTEIGERKELAESLRRVAEVHLARGEPDECRARLEEALRLCSDAGLRREEGNVHRVLGELAAATGDMPGASAEFDRSEEILKAVGRNYELGKALLAMAKCECRMAVERRREKLEEARAIFENLGATALAAEAGAVRDSLIAPVPTADLLSGLTELTLWGLGSAEFARRGLEFITGKLGIPGGAVFLRDGRVFRAGGSEDGGDRKDEPKSGGVSFALEAAGRRLGTLVVYGGVDIGRVKTAVDLFALGLAQAGQTPAPAESGKGKGPRRERIERFPGVVGAETTLKTVFDTVERVAPTKANVLILGESGTGKEIVARALHQRSDRRDKKFIAVNCAAIPEPLLESELLGVEKGTATGVSGRAGKFEQADGGTLFLDEIGDMSLALQAKMLRVLQERSFEKVGGREPISVDVRVVAATNRDLEQAMTEGKFRRDLFFRLNVISLALPPLRERRRDIPSLVDLFIGRVAREYGKPVRGATDDCLACLRAAAWPGNVRELENVIERAVILAAGPYVTVEDLPPAMQGRAAAQTGWRDARKKAEDEAGAEVEESTVVAALEQCGWVVSKAARRLGVSRRHLYRIMERRGIKKPRE